MTVAEIHFNHDTGSASNDAINLRLDGEAGSEIVAPEWVDGEPSQPMAYATEAITGPVTIKVKFKGGPVGEAVNIRAVRPATNAISATRTRGVLGDVKKRSVRFSDSGHSALEVFELTGDLADANVGITQTTWNWQMFQNGDWETFAMTQHRTFVLPALPTPPWNQAPKVRANIGWPWVIALDKACAWAFGTATVKEAAAAIATRINGHPKHVYDEDGMQYIADGRFLLTNYLSDLDNAADFIIDCTGIAAVMVTFANLLGAGLMPLRIQNSTPATFFTTELIAPVGADWTVNAEWITRRWGRHEVAMVPSSLLDEAGATLPGLVIVPEKALPQGPAEGLLIYDASMHVDQSAPVLPIRMPLGSVAAQSHYRFKLIDVGDGGAATPKAVRPLI
jgi:hypothetical protein